MVMANTVFDFPEFRKKNLKQQSRIVATASYFPPRILTNQDIIALNSLSVTDTVIKKTLGVVNRRMAEEGLTDSDLLTRAASICLSRANVNPDQLTKIIVTKFIGDHILPMTASMVQRKLNSQIAMHAFDLEGGVNSFLLALDLATRYISTTLDPDQKILLLSGGIHRAAISKTDPRLAFLFGDGAAALLLAPSQDPHFLASYFYSNHHYSKAAGTVPLKMADWFSDEIYEKKEYSKLYNWYRMENWKDSIDFYLQADQVTAENLLLESKLSMSDVDWFLVTENNRRVRDLTLQALGVSEKKSISLIHEYGNTMSAMLPILFDHASTSGLFEPGMVVMLLSHGEGASGGGLIYRI